MLASGRGGFSSPAFPTILIATEELPFANAYPITVTAAQQAKVSRFISIPKIHDKYSDFQRKAKG